MTDPVTFRALTAADASPIPLVAGDDVAVDEVMTFHTGGITGHVTNAVDHATHIAAAFHTARTALETRG